MELITYFRMLDESWHVGTKYAIFELSYESAVFRAEPPGYVLQFDVSRVDLAAGEDVRGRELSGEGQEMVRVRLGRREGVESGDGGENGEAFKVESVELVPRTQPLPSPISTKIFRTSEWDEYGRHGTWSRLWRIVSQYIWETVVEKLPFFCGMFIIIGIGRLAIRMGWLKDLREMEPRSWEPKVWEGPRREKELEEGEEEEKIPWLHEDGISLLDWRCRFLSFIQIPVCMGSVGNLLGEVPGISDFSCSGVLHSLVALAIYPML